MFTFFLEISMISKVEKNMFYTHRILAKYVLIFKIKIKLLQLSYLVNKLLFTTH